MFQNTNDESPINPLFFTELTKYLNVPPQDLHLVLTEELSAKHPNFPLKKIQEQVQDVMRSVKKMNQIIASQKKYEACPYLRDLHREALFTLAEQEGEAVDDPQVIGIFEGLLDELANQGKFMVFPLSCLGCDYGHMAGCHYPKTCQEQGCYGGIEE